MSSNDTPDTPAPVSLAAEAEALGAIVDVEIAEDFADELAEVAREKASEVFGGASWTRSTRSLSSAVWASGYRGFSVSTCLGASSNTIGGLRTWRPGCSTMLYSSSRLGALCPTPTSSKWCSRERYDM